MSLINDALKKAKQAQTRTPVRETAPQLRSPDLDHPVRPGRSLVWPAVLVAVGLIGATVTWFKFGPQHARSGQPAALVANAAPMVPAAPIVADAPVTEVPSAAPTVEKAPPPSTPAAAPKPTEIPTVASPEPAAPAPPVLSGPRLNGIFFHPARPTAIVNNKLVAVGSRVGEFTVLTITPSGVTLTGGGQTNVLSLSE
jgi:hypothetical protein